MAETTGLVAGRYRLLERVGSGAMGEVWRAHDERLDRVVAVKLLLPATGGERALREARIAARLQHPHAVTVHDVVEHDGRPCLVMEYVPARTLSSVLADRGALPPLEVARLGAQVAAALSAAHDAGIVHRDVKPDNVLLTEDGAAKITDFGISRAVGEGSTTGPGIVVGTPAYLAPEVAAGAPATFASDVFSLGATLYAAVEGGPPFGWNDDAMALLRQVATGQVAPPAHAGPLGPVLLWLLRREPAERPAMARAAAALDAVAAGRGVQLPTLALPARRGHGRLVAAALAAVGLVTAGLVTGILIAAGQHTPVPVAGPPPTAHTRHIPAPTTPPTEACVANYTLVNSWPGGFQAQVTVTNASGAALNGWQVTWRLPDAQAITQLWNGALTQQGSSVTVANLGYNATVHADGSATFGFLGNRSDTSMAQPTVHCAGHR